MSVLTARVVLLTSTALMPIAPFAAQAQEQAPANGRVQMTAADIEAATYTGGDLPAGQSALTAKIQILLDRTGVSPGVVDGFRGGMSESAIRAFERGHNLPMDGRMDPEIWAFLAAYADAPLTMEYTITQDDTQGLVDAIPKDYAEKAKMTSQGYTSVVEKLGERFHMDDKFLAQLNPGVDFVPGATIQVTVPAKPLKAKVARILIDKAAHRVAAYDASGKMVVDYPATIGSDATPSPQGTHTVTAVALNPTYTYDPRKNFKQGDNDKVLIVPPGPNGPVGNVWIDLSQPTYGIHGTPTPSRLFVQESHGCVRLTNWDAQELAHMVQSGTTVVEFLAPGTSIDDVAGPDATLAHAKPPVAAADGVAPASRRMPAGAVADGVHADTAAIDATVQKALDAADPAGAAQGGLLAAGRPGVNPFRNAVTTATAADTLPATVAPGTGTVTATTLPPLPGDAPADAYGLTPANPAAAATPAPVAPASVVPAPAIIPPTDAATSPAGDADALSRALQNAVPETAAGTTPVAPVAPDATSAHPPVVVYPPVPAGN